jgi:hypothetical protein
LLVKWSAESFPSVMRRVDEKKSQLIEWWDAMDTITGQRTTKDIAKGLQMARKCKHDDASWLASLFPNDALVTKAEMTNVMLAQSDDRRAMFLAFFLGGAKDLLLRRAAEMGYAPAQAMLVYRSGIQDKEGGIHDKERFV